MKKFLSLMLAQLTVFAFTACGGSNTAAESEENQEAAEAETEDKTEESKKEEEPEETAPETSADIDISSAIDASTTSDTEPIPLGQWGKTARYATTPFMSVSQKSQHPRMTQNMSSLPLISTTKTAMNFPRLILPLWNFPMMWSCAFWIMRYLFRKNFPALNTVLQNPL